MNINNNYTLKLQPNTIVFHNFHNKRSIKLQGSISSFKFEKIIIKLKKNYNLLNADKFYSKLLDGNLSKKDISLSFDDGLKSQYDIAIPILNKYNIKAFFFVFTSSFTNRIDKLELYKYFRSTQFKTMDKFYKNFFLEINKLKKIDLDSVLSKFEKINYLSEFKFYSRNDRLFRYLRDIILNEENYDSIMKLMMKNKKFNKKNVSKKLYFSKQDLKKINKQNHIIGLHSYTHPTNMDKLSYKKQLLEYKKNKQFIEKELKCKVETMAHPCGKFNKNTIKVLKKLNIKLGFGISSNDNKNMFNISRLDSAYL